MVAARPNRTVEVKAKSKVGVRDSADAQARQITKGKHYFYHYRTYVEVDIEDGFVDVTFTRPTNESEPSSSNDWCGGCPRASMGFRPTEVSRQRKAAGI